MEGLTDTACAGRCSSLLAARYLCALLRGHDRERTYTRERSIAAKPLYPAVRACAKLHTVSGWAQSVFGDPCGECGYTWSISRSDAAALIRAAPARYADALRERDGSERHPDLEWSVGAYVCHVTDNVRIWSERLAGVALGASGQVANYDNDLLARARAYDGVPLQGSLWSLGRAAADWETPADRDRRCHRRQRGRFFFGGRARGALRDVTVPGPPRSGRARSRRSGAWPRGRSLWRWVVDDRLRGPRKTSPAHANQ